MAYEKEISTLYHRKWRQKARAEGRCGGCGREDERTQAGRYFCNRCYENRKKHTEASNARAMEIYYQRKKDGLCVSCGAERDNETLKCSFCRKKSNEAVARHAQKFKLEGKES